MKQILSLFFSCLCLFVNAQCSVNIGLGSIDCSNNGQGSVYAYATGGNGPYTFVWSNGDEDYKIQVSLATCLSHWRKCQILCRNPRRGRTILIKSPLEYEYRTATGKRSGEPCYREAKTEGHYSKR